MRCICPLVGCLCGNSSSSDDSEHPVSKFFHHRNARQLHLESTTNNPLNPNSWHTHGVRLSNWLDSNTTPDCPITESSLTIEQVFAAADIDRIEIPRDQGPALVLPAGSSHDSFVSWKISYVHEVQAFTTNDSIAVSAEGLVLPETNSEEEGNEGTEEHTHPAELIAALFRDEHDLSQLRHIFVLDVGGQTKEFAAMYGRSSKPVTLEYGCREYFVLLGSCAGRAVARGLLGAWPRGTKEVASVVVYCEGPVWNLRFDVVDATPMVNDYN